MKLTDKWKLFLGNILAIAPMFAMASVDIKQIPSQQFIDNNNANNLPPVFKNTLNAESAENLYAAHRSHRSHSSHRSHYSGSGGSRSSYTPPARTYSTPSSTSTYSAPSSTNSSAAGQSQNLSASNKRPDQQKLEDLITRVQIVLTRTGYYAGNLDGKMGKLTRGAIMSHQMDNGLAINGKLDTPTLNSLGILIPN